MKLLPQVVVKDESGNFKIKVACYKTGTYVQIIDCKKHSCISTPLQTYESFINILEEMLLRGSKNWIRFI